jgi:hypothetical protein
MYEKQISYTLNMWWPVNLKKLLSLNDAIKRALPSTYHKPRLALFEDEDHLAQTQDIDNRKFVLFAVYDPNVDTINVSIKEALDLSDVDVAKLLAHEYGHAYFGHKYGFSSKQYFDELECDKFASRWVKKLDTQMLADNKRFCGWREQEIEYLKSKYPTESKERLLKRLGRTWSAIRAKASELGVKRELL